MRESKKQLLLSNGGNSKFVFIILPKLLPPSLFSFLPFPLFTLLTTLYQFQQFLGSIFACFERNSYGEGVCSFTTTRTYLNPDRHTSDTAVAFLTTLPIERFLVTCSLLREIWWLLHHPHRPNNKLGSLTVRFVTCERVCTGLPPVDSKSSVFHFTGLHPPSWSKSV